MATVYSVNKTKQDITVPAVIIPQGELNAKLKVQYDSYSHTAVSATATVVELLPLPMGARIHNAIISHPSMGATGLVSLGWKAGSAIDPDTVTDIDPGSVLVADADGFVVAGSTKAAALVKSMVGVAATAGQFKKFVEAITPIMTFDEGSTTAAVTYKIAIYYTID